jgi:hypothetical protein
VKYRYLVAGLLLLCSCKSGEEKYCDSAKTQRLYDPLRPGLCQETYRKLTPTERACVDKCIGKSPDATVCYGLCDLGSKENMHHTPPPSAPSAPSQ